MSMFRMMACGKFRPPIRRLRICPKSGGRYWHSWVASLTPRAEKSSQRCRPVDDTKDRTLSGHQGEWRANRRRGGNWGMDDSRKRVSRERLEPYFRLHRDANVNIIRNWVGQNTEEIFYDLADEYGLLVWNDFWESTRELQRRAGGSCAVS